MKLLITFTFILTMMSFAQINVVQPSYQENDGLLTPPPLLVRPTELSQVSWSPRDNLIAFVPFYDASSLSTQIELGMRGDIELWQPLSDGEVTTASRILPFASANELEGRNGFSPFPTLLGFSPNGERFAAVGNGLIMYEVSTGDILYSQPAIRGLEWSPDSTRLVTQDYTGDAFTIILWDAATGMEIQRFRALPEPGRAPSIVSFSWGNPEEVAFVYNNDNRGILNVSTGVVTDISDCCIEDTFELQWQPEGRLLASHDRIYDLDTRQPVFFFPWQSRVSWSPDGEWLLGSLGSEASLISIAQQRVVLRFSTNAIGEANWITGIEWSADGHYLLLNTGTIEEIAYPNNFVSIWDIRQIMADAEVSAE